MNHPIHIQICILSLSYCFYVEPCIQDTIKTIQNYYYHNFFLLALRSKDPLKTKNKSNCYYYSFYSYYYETVCHKTQEMRIWNEPVGRICIWYLHELKWKSCAEYSGRERVMPRSKRALRHNHSWNIVVHWCKEHRCFQLQKTSWTTIEKYSAAEVEIHEQHTSRSDPGRLAARRRASPTAVCMFPITASSILTCATDIATVIPSDSWRKTCSVNRKHSKRMGWRAVWLNWLNVGRHKRSYRTIAARKRNRLRRLRIMRRNAAIHHFYCK